MDQSQAPALTLTPTLSTHLQECEKRAWTMARWIAGWSVKRVVLRGCRHSANKVNREGDKEYI